MICSCTVTLFAQDNGDSKTKIKENKTKTKDDNGKLKVKTNTDINTDNDAKIKIKDDKLKIKTEDGKLKMKTDGDMNSGTMSSGMGNMNTSTDVNVVIINGWRTDPAKLPLVGNGVTDDVVTNLKNKYGSSIYDIKKIRSTSGENIYVVRLMENGNMRTDYVAADGSNVSR